MTADSGALARALREQQAPGEAEAAERAWPVVRAAHATREPVPHPVRLLRPALAAAFVAVLAAAALSPPGRALVGEVREAIGVEEAQRALFRLPAGGPGVLVESESGPWVVRPDGSKRRLGSWREASWSPYGVFVVAASADELAALEPDGDVRWKLARPVVRHPRWGGTRLDTRVAYLSGRALRVVAGDGRGDRRLAPAVRAVPPAWRPGGRHVLAFVAADGRVAAVEADTGRRLWSRAAGDVRGLQWSKDGRLLLVRGRSSLVLLGPGGRIRYSLLRPPAAPVTAARIAPGGRSVAFVARTNGRSELWVIPRLRPDGSAARRVFSGAGTFSDLEWSPDGRWLLVGWREADQWVFIRSAGVGKLEAVSGITGQFDSTRFPRVAGWCCG
jgi:outer membrane protein assembly factor BamB